MLFRVPIGFATLLARLGIRSPDAVFDLSTVVVPVSLVDPDPFIANALPPAFGTPATAGEVAPAALGRLADTGALTAGNYFIQWFVYNSNGGDTFRLARRNAADAADVWSIRLTTAANGVGAIAGSMRVAVLAGERLILLDVLGSGSLQQGVIFAALT